MTPRRLEYAPGYFRRLEDIRERIAADNPTAAIRMIERIRAAVTRLAISSVIMWRVPAFNTRDTVEAWTPARRATSRSVIRSRAIGRHV